MADVIKVAGRRQTVHNANSTVFLLFFRAWVRVWVKWGQAWRQCQPWECSSLWCTVAWAAQCLVPGCRSSSLPRRTLRTTHLALCEDMQVRSVLSVCARLSYALTWAALDRCAFKTNCIVKSKKNGAVDSYVFVSIFYPLFFSLTPPHPPFFFFFFFWKTR